MSGPLQDAWSDIESADHPTTWRTVGRRAAQASCRNPELQPLQNAQHHQGLSQHIWPVPYVPRWNLTSLLIMVVGLASLAAIQSLTYGWNARSRVSKFFNFDHV